MRSTVESDATQDELEAVGRAMEGSSPLDILSWAADRYASRLTFATDFGPEGCVLTDSIDRHTLPIDIHTLDTGRLFEATYEL